MVTAIGAVEPSTGTRSRLASPKVLANTTSPVPGRSMGRTNSDQVTGSVGSNAVYAMWRPSPETST